MKALSPSKIQSRLFILAGIFITLYSAGLSLAPVIRLQTPDEQPAWLHWFAWLTWIIFSIIVHQYSFRHLPKHDPYLLPASFLLCGWGLFTIFRLFPYYGLRQTAWFSIAAIVLLIGFRLPLDLSFLRRYKYLWLTFGLILTALTVLFGTNPSGFSEQRLWLGCCGLYFQPSEPLKLLLIVYLSAYLADRLLVSKGIRPSATISGSLFTILAPTLFMTGMAILLLIIQRDLGTAFIFIFLYAAIIFIATGEWKVLLAAILSVSLASLVGYGLFDVVRIRFESWINPWIDPSGRSYQIIQSLIAIANGDILGRGPGMGSPSLVPVPHSDFIFASITEELGLMGAVGLLLIIALVMNRGIVIAINASGNFRRYLAAGLTVYLVAQSLLIIGGNIRMVPLTGVTLPFVSYGGSSLVISFIAILLLVLISSAEQREKPPMLNSNAYLLVSGFLFALVVIAIGFITWWAFVRSSDLLSRTDNARRSIADRYVQRGSILDREYRKLVTSQKVENNGSDYIRRIDYPELSNIIGYTHPVFGQAGVEFAMDTYLRGLSGYPDHVIEFHQLLYGVPPPGIDIQLTLDASLESFPASLLDDTPGVIALVNAETGEILTLLSTPVFDANQLDKLWEELINDPLSPLLNRTTQGLYPPGLILAPLIYAQWISESKVNLSHPDTITLFSELGFFKPVAIELPSTYSIEPSGTSIFQNSNSGRQESLRENPGKSLQINPLQLAIASSSLLNKGRLVSPLFVSAIGDPEKGWIIRPENSYPIQIFTPESVKETTTRFHLSETPYWGMTSTVSVDEKTRYTWFFGGSMPSSIGPKFSLAILLEKNQPELVVEIAKEILKFASESVR